MCKVYFVIMLFSIFMQHLLMLVKFDRYVDICCHIVYAIYIALHFALHCIYVLHIYIFFVTSSHKHHIEKCNVDQLLFLEEREGEDEETWHSKWKIQFKKA